MSPETAATLLDIGKGIGLLIAGAAALLGGQRGLRKLKSHRNGTDEGIQVETNPSTIKLLQLEAAWREKVDQAVGQTALQEQRLTTLERTAARIEAKLDTISGQIADVRVDVAEQGKCCEHCPGK